MPRATVDRPVRDLEQVRKAWNYPLFQSIFQRRARRFPLGAEMPGGVAPFKSERQPVPLDEIEEAMLVMVGTGLSGLNLSDLPFSDAEGSSHCGNTMIQFQGRTYASPCGSHGTELFFTNDEGTYMVKMKDKQPKKMVEFENEDDWENIIDSFRANTVKIGDGRLDIPMSTGITLPFNQWNVNKPGSTLFMPVSDVTWEYINIMMLLMDEPNRYYVYDDITGEEPLKKYADAGLLDKSRPYGLTALEGLSNIAITGAEQPLMLQNMYLATQALGLGGWIFGATPGPVVMGGVPEVTKGMGFRFMPVENKGPRKQPDFVGAGVGNPVGLDGLYEAYCPPYYPTMGDAVQAIYDAKWGSTGIFKEEGGPAPVVERQSMDRHVPKTTQWCLDATKDLSNYIWDTYGRFPATIDAMQMSIWFQSHHLETDFYDKYYQQGAYHENIANHFENWHKGVEPARSKELAGTSA